MGLFDFFEEANEQFRKDVGKAWDELWDKDTSEDDDDTGDESSSSDVLENIWNVLKPRGPIDGPTDGGIMGRGNPIKDLSKLIGGSPDHPIQKLFQTCFEPAPGTPVYCKLAAVVEHTGIYIGDGEIVHLNGDGNIEIVSPQEFLARLDGLNPAISIL